MGVLNRLDSRIYIMIRAFVFVLLIGIAVGAPRVLRTSLMTRRSTLTRRTRTTSSEGEADVAGWLASKSCIDSGKLLQCTKSAKGICPEDKLKKEGVDLEEKEKTCIDSAKLLRCIRSVRIVCPKSSK